MIYLDNAATTCIIEENASFAAKNAKDFFNPSAAYAQEARNQIENARKTLAEYLGASADEIYFTSCATEANNWAIFSGATKKQKLKAVTSAGEHASVYESFTELSRRGIQTVISPLLSDTRVNADKLIENASCDCGFISLIHVSNETGAINDIGAIFSEIKKRNPNVILHSDGVQAFGKISTQVGGLGADLYVVSGHKIGAPKGIGALYIKKGVQIRPLLFGGEQENKLRAGTENVGGITAFAAAIEAYSRRYRETNFTSLRESFLQILYQADGINLNGSLDNSVCSIFSVSVRGVKAEILQRVLAEKDGVIIGLGSACSKAKRGNRVLEAAGKTKLEAEESIRISFGADTNLEFAKQAAQLIAQRIGALRQNCH